ncbi:MAG: hypothetical protein ABJP48_13525 [Erythrobacter sp.]
MARNSKTSTITALPATSPHATTSTTPTPQTATIPSIRHDGWTRQRQCTFLQTLAASHSVAQAARAAGMSRQSAYALRARMKGEPFDLAWNAALRCRFDALAEAAMDRAMNGVEVPHFYKGELVHTSRRFDERLTVALLAMRDGFRAAHVPITHSAADYRPDDFGALLGRVERGPDTWMEQMQREYDEEPYELPDEEPHDEGAQGGANTAEKRDLHGGDCDE